MKSTILSVLGLTIAWLGAPAFAQNEGFPKLTAEEQAYLTELKELVEPLEPETGAIKLSRAPVSLEVPASFEFYDASESRVILEDIWGNPEDRTVLGMIFPAGSKWDYFSSWGVVLTYESSGYVSDKDATKIDYDKLMRGMQKDAREANPYRKEAGYPELEIVGWAEPPTYNAEDHRMFWGKELAFEGEPEHTLNYDMRVLGRGGVLSMNVVGGIGELQTVRAVSADILAMPAFNSGQAYEDYVKGDRTADYGLAALITGGAGLALAKKAGFLGLILAFGKKFIVLIVAGIAALFGSIGKMFGGGRKTGGDGPLG